MMEDRISRKTDQKTNSQESNVSFFIDCIDNFGRKETISKTFIFQEQNYFSH